jgi:exodeoxyribonuclease-3
MGFNDSYRDLNPDSTQFTWWDYRMLGFQKNLGLRIDLLLASVGLKARLRRCYVDRDERKGDKPSDHAPVILELI